MLKEFREFALKGNVVDLAVGVIIGTAFGKVTSSLVNDILMPPLGLLLGKIDFSDKVIFLTTGSNGTLPITIQYGMFITTVIDFIIVAFVVFLFIKQMNRLRAEKPKTPDIQKACPFCTLPIAQHASRCPHCTSSISL